MWWVPTAPWVVMYATVQAKWPWPSVMRVQASKAVKKPRACLSVENRISPGGLEGGLGAVSLTSAVHWVGALVSTEAGLQMTVVVVGSRRTVTEPVPVLLVWTSSPWYSPVIWNGPN